MLLVVESLLWSTKLFSLPPFLSSSRPVVVRRGDLGSQGDIRVPFSHGTCPYVTPSSLSFRV